MPPDLEIVAFEQAGSAEVRRDETLVLRFSTPLDPRSVDHGTVRLFTRKGWVEEPVSIEVRDQILLLRPPEPFGFEPATRYRLLVEGFPSLSAPRSREGRTLHRPFRASFRTSRFYGPDLIPPRVEEATASEEPGGRFSVTLRFTEAVDPRTVEVGESLVVLDAISGLPLDGRVTGGRDARVFRFVPSGTARPGPIRVRLTRGVSDLAGNPLAPEEGFLAELNLPAAAPAPPVGEILEDFSSTGMMDPVHTTARWNERRAPGALLGEPANTALELPGEADQPEIDLALGGEAVVARILLTRDELGAAREFTGVHWWPSGAVVPGEYERVRVRITPTLAEAVCERGFDLGLPVTVQDQQPYRTPRGFRRTVAIPFSRPYSWDGTSNLLLEVSFGGGDRTNFLRAREVANGRAEVEREGRVLPVRPILSLHGFSMEPVATSLFYDTGSDSPTYLGTLLDPDGQPDGVELAVRYQGAHRLPRPGEGEEETRRDRSAWLEDITSLRGYRYLRFRLTFRGVSLSEEQALVDDLRIFYRP